MGKKGPLAMVTPEELRVRTNLRLSSRSGSTLKVDAAYEAYYYDRSEANRARLHEQLRQYLVQHGGYWDGCERDKVSGGLLAFLFKFTAPKDPVPTAETLMDQRAG